MQEINVKNNPTNMKVSINGVPRCDLIPTDQLIMFAAALEHQISLKYDKKQNRKQILLHTKIPTSSRNCLR